MDYPVVAGRIKDMDKMEQIFTLDEWCDVMYSGRIQSYSNWATKQRPQNPWGADWVNVSDKVFDKITAVTGSQSLMFSNCTLEIRPCSHFLQLVEQLEQC